MARQPAKAATPAGKRRTRRPAKAAAKPAPESKAAAPPKVKEPITLPGVGAASTKLRTVMLNFAFVAAFLVLVPVIVSQFWRNEVLIDRIPVPAALADLGLTPDVAASRLWDGLRDATTRARTSKQSLTAIPNSQRVQFTLPESGFSMESLIQQTRQFFNAYQTRIGGEFTCSEPSCERAGIKLRLRVMTDRVEVVDMPPLGDTPLRDYFTAAGVQVLTLLDPFVAVAAIQEDQPARALVLARNLVRGNHQDAKWAHNLIGNLKSNSDPEGAIAAYRAALDLDPGFVIARANLAAMLTEAGRIAEAREHYAVLQRDAPDNLNALAGLVRFAIADKRLDDAEALALKGQNLAPKDPYYVSMMGDVWQERGEAQKARAAYEAALVLDPSYIPALGALGLGYLQAGDFASAEPLYADFVAYAPDNVDANLMYARLLQARGEPAKALTRYEHALSLRPDDPVILTEAAGALAYLDRGAEAIGYLKRALVIDDTNASAHGELGRLQMLAGNMEDARISFSRAMELAPEDVSLLDSAAFFFSASGDHAEAARLTERVLELAPDHVTSLFALGNYHKFAGHRDEALTAYRKYLAAVPALPVFADSRKLAEDAIAELSPPQPGEASP